MKVTIKGSGNSVDLTKSDYIASGGFGAVYAKHSTAYKIYTDPAKIIPEAKIAELSLIKNTNVIKPEHLLLNQRNQPCGYTMKLVPDSYVLCQLFPKPFRLRNNLTSDHVIKLVCKMRETISSIHSHGVLIVDLNEMNFLVDKQFKEVYFIDVDSYQTTSFPADALMERIRDRHAVTGRFSPDTDWFSFAITSYQMFRGIHPYKGKHTKYASLDERMINNVSIHNKDVTYPLGAVLPIDVVPQVYQEWYRAVLDDGKRVAPPKNLVAIIHVVTKQPHIVNLSGSLFDIIPLGIFSRKSIHGSGGVSKIYQSGNHLLCRTGDHIYNERGPDIKIEPNAVVGFTPKQNIPIAVSIDKQTNSIIATRLDTGHAVQTLPSKFQAEGLLECEGRIYYKNGPYLMQLCYAEGIEIKLMSSLVANVMERSTELFDGVAVQNILGSNYINIFPADKVTYQFKFPELNKSVSEMKNSRVVAAKYDQGILMIVASKAGRYNRYIYTFGKDFKNYQTRIVSDVSYSDLNFVVLPQGICVSSNEDDSIELFSVTDINNTKNLRDPATAGLTLLKENAKVVFEKDGKFYQLKTK